MALGLEAEGSSGSHRPPQKVPGRQVRNPKLASELSGLRAFARAGRAEEHHAMHRRLRRPFGY
jgi:hypothetical protein